LNKIFQHGVVLSFLISIPVVLEAHFFISSVCCVERKSNDPSDHVLTRLFEGLQSGPKGFLRIKSAGDGERGMFTNRFAAKSSIILSIPMELWLTDRSPPGWFTEKIDKTATFFPSSWATRLAAAVIDLQLRDKNGIWTKVIIFGCRYYLTQKH
jgi:hypothetical protein